jgi:type IV secretion system protein TrbG
MEPQAVYDNGQKTFIRFDPSILHGESPALFVMEPGEVQLVNCRVKQNLYIVDRLFEVAELRLGQYEQDIVRLRNCRIQPPPGCPGAALQSRLPSRW